MLCDSGPLVALVDHRQADHARCTVAARAIGPPVVTSWAVLAESMHLLGRMGGHRYQDQLWQLHASGFMSLHVHSDVEIRRMSELMARYQNVPMDLADASLIAIAETTRERTIFTLDSDFHIYRLTDGTGLSIVPQ